MLIVEVATSIGVATEMTDISKIVAPAKANDLDGVLDLLQQRLMRRVQAAQCRCERGPTDSLIHDASCPLRELDPRTSASNAEDVSNLKALMRRTVGLDDRSYEVLADAITAEYHIEAWS